MLDPAAPTGAAPILADDGAPAAGVGTVPAGGLDYARRLFQNVTEWYGSADTKAQVILTVDAAFIAFLSGSMFAEPAKVGAMAAALSPATWTLLVLMSLSLAGSVMSALACLWSRLYRHAEVAELFGRLGVDARKAESYAPEVMWFFQLVRHLDPEQFRARLQQLDEAQEVDALAFQIVALSANVTRKHAWVNAGFVLAGASFLLFLAAGMSYVAVL